MQVQYCAYVFTCKEELLVQLSYYHALRVTLVYIGRPTDSYTMDLNRQFADQIK